MVGCGSRRGSGSGQTETEKLKVSIGGVGRNRGRLPHLSPADLPALPFGGLWPFLRLGNCKTHQNSMITKGHPPTVLFTCFLLSTTFKDPHVAPSTFNPRTVSMHAYALSLSRWILHKPYFTANHADDLLRYTFHRTPSV